MQTKTIRIPENEAAIIQKWLDSNKPISDAGEIETVKCFTAIFDDGIEVDIKVCNSDTGPYIDAVMFEDNCEIGFLEVRDTLIGIYDFREDQDFYRVIVEIA